MWHKVSLVCGATQKSLLMRSDLKKLLVPPAFLLRTSEYEQLTVAF